jgi:hypothetical protein
MSIHTSSVDIIKEKFVCREEILDVFCGFSCCKFGFLEGNYGWWSIIVDDELVQVR